MQYLEKNEIKEIQLGILDYVDEICKKNDIPYFLSYGTMLGAVRHKGMIPWDDDIDISLYRKDYERLPTSCISSPFLRYLFMVFP